MFSSLLVVAAVALTSAINLALAQCPCRVDSRSALCDDSALTSIPDCVPNNISLLYIRTPSIPLVADNIRRFTDLEELYIGWFDNVHMSKTFLSAQPDIQSFGIYKTVLDYVDSEWFLHAPGIKNLFLYNNSIVSLAAETFSSLPQLDTVLLMNNQLRSLPPTLFQGTALKFIYLMGNPWQCDCELATFVQWTRDNGVIINDQATCLYPSDLEELELTQLTLDDACEK